MVLDASDTHQLFFQFLTCCPDKLTADLSPTLLLRRYLPPLFLSNLLALLFFIVLLRMYDRYRIIDDLSTLHEMNISCYALLMPT